MAPTAGGIVGVAKALQDEKVCDKVKISGLGMPSELVSYPRADACLSSLYGASSTSVRLTTTHPI